MLQPMTEEVERTNRVEGVEEVKEVPITRRGRIVRHAVEM